LTIIAIVFVSFAATAEAAIQIAQEDFDGYTYFPNQKPAGDPVNLGVPLTTEGADSALWLAARFEKGDTTPDIGKDVGVQKQGSTVNKTPVGRAGDDAGLVLRLDLTGYMNVTLDFDWRTFSADSTDQFVVAYYQGDGTEFQLEGLGMPNGVYDWFNDPQLGNGDLSANISGNPTSQWYFDNWTELYRLNPNNVFTHKSTTLPSGDILYLAFWMDNGDGDFAKFDNILVMGDPKPPTGNPPVPEPLSVAVWVLLATCAGGVSARSRG
jgi:hypothetical protein